MHRALFATFNFFVSPTTGREHSRGNGRPRLQVIRIFDSILAPKLADFDVEIKPLAAHIAQATLRVSVYTQLWIQVGRTRTPHHVCLYCNEMPIRDISMKIQPDGIIVCTCADLGAGFQFEICIRTSINDLVCSKSLIERWLHQVYQASTETFLPTPVKSHYLFNMRDVAKVIEGVMQVRHSNGLRSDNPAPPSSACSRNVEGFVAS